jgi:copper chaperone NosL
MMSRFSRCLLVIAGVLLAVSLRLPLWRIALTAPQYPEGLGLQINAGTIAGATPQDLGNINELNHYIGMRPIDPGALPELRVLPWILAGLAVMALVAAALGSRRVVAIWLGAVVLVGLAGLADLYRWSYTYGHDLDAEHAIIKVPGMVYQPPLIGTKQLLNFTASSWPAVGTWLAVAALLAGAVALVVSRHRVSAPASAA